MLLFVVHANVGVIYVGNTMVLTFLRNGAPTIVDDIKRCCLCELTTVAAAAVLLAMEFRAMPLLFVMATRVDANEDVPGQYNDVVVEVVVLRLLIMHAEGKHLKDVPSRVHVAAIDVADCIGVL
jgi:hypothetical protein